MKKCMFFVLFLAALCWAGGSVAQAQIEIRILPPGWVAPEPPREFHDAGRKGFHDGIEAARHDAESRRPLDAGKHEEFRHPPVPRDFHDEYRNGFQRGYDEVIHHLVAQEHAEHRMMPPPPPAHGFGWENDYPREFHDAGRQGFRDGIAAARRDFDGRQRPDTGRHPEFKHPPVDRGFQDEYRIGFQRGYDTAFDHLRNGR